MFAVLSFNFSFSISLFVIFSFSNSLYSCVETEKMVLTFVYSKLVAIIRSKSAVLRPNVELITHQSMYIASSCNVACLAYIPTLVLAYTVAVNNTCHCSVGNKYY